MKKKVLSVLLVAAMAMSMLTGCGSKPAGNDAQSVASSEASKETEAAAETTASAEDETLTVWCWDPNFNVYAMKQAESCGCRYHRELPNFKLDIQEKVYSDIETALITAAEAGDYSTLLHAGMVKVILPSAILYSVNTSSCTLSGSSKVL